MPPYTLVLKNEKRRSYSRLTIFFVIVNIAAVFFKWWLAILLLPIYIFYRITTRKLPVIIGNDIISYPSFPTRSIEWSELSNLILKDGLLTLDFKNNKIIQQLVDEDFQSPGEKEFNEFCKQRLTV
jgi:hypothetical protein